MTASASAAPAAGSPLLNRIRNGPSGLGLRGIWVALLLFVASNIFIFAVGQVDHSFFGARSQHLADFCQWDCTWYETILDSGYYLQLPGNRHPNWPFFPLFPLLAFAVKHLIGVSTPLALVISSRLAFFTAILSFLLLVRDEMENLSDYLLAGALVAFNPYVIYAHSGYTEPLYFTLCALAFSLLSQKRWIGSGVAGAFLSATRLPGSLFAIAYLITSLREGGLRRFVRGRPLAVPLGLLLCPLGLVLFALYLHHHTGDVLAFVHGQSAFVGGVTPGNPLRVLWLALLAGRWKRLWAVMALAGFAASAWLFKLRRPEMGIYLVFALLMPLTVMVASFPRYLWWQPPFLYAIFTFLKRYSALWVIYLVLATAAAALMVLAWFSGRVIVI